jgi:serine/threonine-protein kinase
VDAADEDSWRRQWRAAVARRDEAELRRLAGAGEVARQPPQTVLLLARHLAARSPQRAAELLRAAQQRTPGDFWINYLLASAVWNQANLAHADPAAYDEAIRFDTAALALRPDNPEALVHLGMSLLWRGRADEAQATLLHALDLAPQLPRALNSLGNVLWKKGRFEDAAVAYRKCIELAPEDPRGHNNLALFDWRDGQRFDEAVAGLRRTLALSRDDPEWEVVARASLGMALLGKGRFHEAAAVSGKAAGLGQDAARYAGVISLLVSGKADAVIDFCRLSIARQPEDALAHLGLGLGRECKGQFAEAREDLRRGHELIAKRPSLTMAPTERQLRDAERMQEQDGQLAAYAAGSRKPKDRDELRTLVFVCVVRRRPLLAARLHEQALAADAAWADDPHAEARYDAARFAALAAAGRGEDAAALDEPERARWRRQAVRWLRDELARVDGSLAAATPLDRGIALDRLRWWQQEPDLAGLREPDAVQKLPADEQGECRKLWAEVEGLLKRAEKGE